MQTILGSGGAIGTDLARELKKYSKVIRLVSRNPKKVNEADELFPADLSRREEVFRAVDGSEIVYLTIGFEYNLRAWREKWPPLMRNVIDACTTYGSKLVFFDNVYMYDCAHIPHMTEETPVNPCSRKGEIRKEVAGMLLEAVAVRSVTALIARSADFYGPGIRNSALYEMVVKNLKSGKAANWLGSAGHVHNFTYTPDAAVATALLGNTPDAFGQVWHLPTDHTPLKGKEWIEMIASQMGVKPKISVLPIWMMGILGLFVPVMRELKEMAYQMEQDYFFDSSKFEKRFGMQATRPENAIRVILESS